MERIGIFGGSFNPPHLGHILAVREFQEKLSLDRVLLIPAATPPHKTLTTNSPAAVHRLEMTRLAAADLPYAEVSDIELRREGASYTADTLDELRRLYPRDEFFLLMGTDMFLSFETWYHPERIAAQATVAVAHRSADNAQQLRTCADRLRDKLELHTVFVENEYLPHSSTSVRALLAFQAAEEYIAPAVLDYILKNDLYFSRDDLKGLSFDRLQEVSLCLHNKKRVPHVIGCSDTAARLALKYGADPVDAKRAGILHDVTKALNSQEQLKLCDHYGMILDNFERMNPKLLHAKTGAVIAEQIFGENPAVCDAIRWHTTGKANMSVLEKIIYLADYMEPNRAFDGVDELRRLTEENLDDALYLGLTMTMGQLKANGREIDKNSSAALHWLEERKQSR
ncbi:MAG: nicotinate (nicotinamide) nucleotide adenylyltransferase [Oscillospiraceae bacterium]|nr:nicotinate (nicotinamide) nucleotide adenylyltransferase [Oscillospiraceae bacterium]